VRLCWAKIRHIIFIPIINIFDFLFEYFLLNKLPILAKKKIKNQNWVEITEYHVLAYICTQTCQQITKLDFFDLKKYFGKIT
jgi:hypothetical protein